MWKSIFAIAVGSTLGGLLRWGLGLKLNSLLPDLPPGTLAANLIAGYLVGLALAYFAQAPELSPEWRLLLITGFCGGLSTFSTFSAEVVSLLQRGLYAWAMSASVIHVAGSVVMTLAGIATVVWLDSL
ncbi:MAG TPA: fluoride efflux transporter CrcB [Gammaproteobacteria bacterium]|nr:fluoride efflux transporter CrcB [Gammaproteobacteria bacterium]